MPEKKTRVYVGTRPRAESKERFVEDEENGESVFSDERGERRREPPGPSHQ